jgi:hypothetical protein
MTPTQNFILWNMRGNALELENCILRICLSHVLTGPVDTIRYLRQAATLALGLHRMLAGMADDLEHPKESER